MKALKDTRILGMPLAFYLVLTAATLFISIRGNLLDNMIGAVACSLLIGTGLGVIGDKIPIWNQWLGGGSYLPISLPPPSQPLKFCRNPPTRHWKIQ